MKVILMREHGAIKTLSVSRGGAIAVAVVVCALIVASLGALVVTLRADSVDYSVIQNWRAKIEAQSQEVAAVQKISDAQKRAVGRQLAEMQARLWRMEALASRIQESADLAVQDIDLTEPTAQGGPTTQTEDLLSWPKLDDQLAELRSLISTRDSQLNLIDDIMINQRREESTRIAGRPILQGWMSSPFGKRVDPISGVPAWHQGMDFAGPKGSEVVAVASGLVIYAGRKDGYGKLVEVSHGEGFITRYGHHQELVVNVGDVVKKGDVVGLMGSTGRSTGPHVHFEVLRNGRAIDPANFVNRK